MSDRRRKMIAALRAEHALDGDTVFLAAAEMSSKCHKRTYVPGELFLVVANTANLISDLRV